MKLIEPPYAATWMLAHLVPGERNEAMAGDLMEELRNGRSSSWYWRQVLAAIAVGCYRDLVHHGMALAFAAVWSLLTPAWFVVFDKFRNESSVTGSIYRMDWPWSMVSDLGLSAAANLAFIGSAMFLFVFMQTLLKRSFSFSRLWRALFLILVVYSACWVALLGLSSFLPAGHALDRRTFTPLNAITNIKIWLGSLPLILALICSLWGATSQRHGERSKIVASS